MRTFFIIQKQSSRTDSRKMRELLGNNMWLLRIVVRAFCITAFFVLLLYHIFYRLSTIFGKRVVEDSLRLGHTRVLTSHRDVIHYARAASLRRPLRVCSGL